MISRGTSSLAADSREVAMCGKLTFRWKAGGMVTAETLAKVSSRAARRILLTY